MTSYLEFLFRALLTLTFASLYIVFQYSGTLPIYLNDTQKIGLVLICIITFYYSKVFVFLIKEKIEKK